jgi:hypothetical protein
MVIAILAAGVAGYLISLVRKQSSPQLTINPSGSMQLWKAAILITYLILSTATTAYAVYSLWNVTAPGSQTVRPVPATVAWYAGPWHWEIGTEVQLILLVLFTGAFGASIYGLKSFADFIGIRQLQESWFVFYLVQPWKGAGIAFLFYMVMRGGLLAGSGGDARLINPFGVTAIAALVGAFSDRALSKLRDVFDALLSAGKPAPSPDAADQSDR